MPEAAPAHVANARMYAVTPIVAEAWRALFAWVGREADVPLRDLDHAAPAPIDDLWARPDLGLVFACGYPFARGLFPLQPLAAPIPSPARYGGRPVYCTDLVVRRDSPIRTLPDAFGGRVGWTVAHSQSGFQAVRHHLLTYRGRGAGSLFRDSVGPLVTPRAVIAAILSGAIDVGPLDSYVHDLLREHEPATAEAVRVVESTAMTAIPLLVASPELDPEAAARLTAALLRAGPDVTEIAGPLSALLLAGFGPVDRDAYAELAAQADRADASGRLAL